MLPDASSLVSVATSVTRFEIPDAIAVKSPVIFVTTACKAAKSAANVAILFSSSLTLCSKLQICFATLYFTIKHLPEDSIILAFRALRFTGLTPAHPHRVVLGHYRLTASRLDAGAATY
jgi:hypothetical protein